MRAAKSRALALVFLVVLQHPALAQRVSGVVHDSAASAAIGGAVVTVLDSADHSLSQALTDATGHYSIARTAPARRIKVLRIGFEPRTLALPAGVAAINVGMLRVPTLLSAMLVSDRSQCTGEGDRGAALSLWEQARAGLLSSVVARDANPSRATTWTYQRVLNADDGLVLKQSTARKSGRTTRPFGAADTPEVLSERGYVDSDGTDRTFKAPDADVLLDDSFARTHCFHVTPADATHPDAVGLSFEPVQKREAVVDVRGTLWLSTGTPALRSLEFIYSDRDAVLARSGAGGRLEFHTMPSGVAFVSTWKVRLPVWEAARPKVPAYLGGRSHPEDQSSASSSAEPRVAQWSETGGVVLSAKWEDGASWDSPSASVAGLLVEADSKLPVRGALFVLGGTSDTVATDSAGRFLLAPILPGRYSARVVDTSMSRFIEPRTSQRDIIVTGSDTASIHFEIPSRSATLRTACGDHDADRGITLMGRVANSNDVGSLPDDARVVAAWVRDNSSVVQETQTVGLDRRGRFSICGIASGRTLHLSVVRGSGTYADTTMIVDASRGVALMDWHLGLGIIAGAPRNTRSALRGRVSRSDTGAPVAGADVWLPLLDRRAITDKTGSFWLEGLPSGHILLQIRHIGYPAVRDTLTLSANAETTRTFQLTAQTTMLDTVRTTTSQMRYLSPALQGFENRRLAGDGGYFLSDSTLREHDREALASVLLSRVAGVKLVPGRGGASYLASSRKTCAGGAFSSGSACTPCFVTVHIDGTLIYSAATQGTPPPDASRLRVDEIAGVEYYPSGGTGPAAYNATGEGCGHILIWTRER